MTPNQGKKNLVPHCCTGTWQSRDKHKKNRHLRYQVNWWATGGEDPKISAEILFKGTTNFQ